MSAHTQAKAEEELDAICSEIANLSDRVEALADSQGPGAEPGTVAAIDRVLGLLRQTESRATEILL